MHQNVKLKAVHEGRYDIQATFYDYVVDAPDGSTAAAEALKLYRSSPDFIDPTKGKLLSHSVIHIEPCAAPAPLNKPKGKAAG